MNDVNQAVLDHHRAAAHMWGLGGSAYDDISFVISDALAHGAQRLSPRPGEEVLDVATGTGWTARNLVRFGARVTAVDISADLLAAAKALAAHLEPGIDFRLADAERLPFEDARFDRVISTFGVMFAANQAQAAAELARVCKPGGRLVLVTWVPRGSVEAFFAVIGKHSDAPAPADSPLAWGAPEEVRRLLGGAFELTFERGVSHAYHDDPRHIWEWYARGFGPVRECIEALTPAGLEAFRRDVDAYHGHYLTEAGMLHIEREYLVTIGRRRGADQR